MNGKLKKICSLLLAVLLTADILTGCITKRSAPELSAGTETSETKDYEEYRAAYQETQKQFDELTEQIFRDQVTKSTIDLHYTLADPSAYGISETPITYGDFNLEQMAKDTQDLKDIKASLSAIDSKSLTKSQRLTYDILSSYIETELSSEGMELYAQPLGPTIGLQAQLPVLLAEYAFYTRQDVDNYLALLSKIDEYYQQILDFEKKKSEAGLFMSDISVDHIVESCSSYLFVPEDNFLTETFEERLNGLADVTEEEKEAYKAQHIQILADHFVPAYQNLIDGLNALKGTGTNEKGLCEFPRGKEFYEYLVRSSTGTSYETIDDLRDGLMGQLDKDLSAISDLIAKDPAIAYSLENQSFALTDPGEILEHLKVQISKDFPELPECNYTVKYVPKALELSLSPAFYLTPPIDRFTENVIYINRAEQYQSEELYPVLAHEGYPGHLYQTVYFSNKSDSNLRSLLSFTSYSEGWATYVENYSYSLDNGLDKETGQVLAHNSVANLALHAYLDLQINYYGWNKEQVTEFLQSYFNIDTSDIAENMYYTLIENPTNYLEYYVGYLEIVNMRDKAQEVLGDDFNLKEFNTFLLDIGPAPFSVIQPYFNTWLLSVNPGRGNLSDGRKIVPGQP